MSRSLTIKLDLTVADDANDFAVADFVFNHLMNCENADNKAIESIDGTMPSRAS